MYASCCCQQQAAHQLFANKQATTRSLMTKQSMMATGMTPPPLLLPEVPTFQQPPRTPNRNNFEQKWMAMLERLHELFVHRWVPMTNSCQTEGKFTTTKQQGRVLEKLPEGKTSSIMS